jgi:outer membrane protein OmpA-like peptidoglycan-associated protein
MSPGAVDLPGRLSLFFPLISGKYLQFLHRINILKPNLLSMKRTSLLFFITICFIAYSHAQLKVAIVGGGHQSKVIEDNDLPGWDSLKNFNSGRNGIHLGFMADLRFNERSNFYFQPAVMFFNKGRKYRTPNQDTTLTIKRPPLDDSTFDTYHFQQRKNFRDYIDIPLNVVYKLKLAKKFSFVLGGGPYVSFFYDGYDKSENIIVEHKTVTEENNDLAIGDGAGKHVILNYGVNALAGFEFGRVTLTANYSRGLNDFYQPAGYTATNFKHEVMGATLGIFLGKPVQQKARDSDGDGTPDKTDKCPDVAGSADMLGCPDTDKDGIADPEDKCPGEAGPADNLGCPYGDKDGDGLTDNNDQCPDLAGPRENKGCPYPDTDKDGIADKDDSCPAKAGFARYKGCPVPDTDGDGINDEEDKCPNARGIAARNGCPEEIKKEIVQKVNMAAKRIQFRYSSSQLTTESFAVLDEVAGILKSNPDIRVIIEGHTSSDGIREVNMRLSQNRAENVKKYLQSRGIAENRLTTIGYGPDKPVNQGKTEAEKAKNRRVEMRLSNQ